LLKPRPNLTAAPGCLWFLGLSLHLGTVFHASFLWCRLPDNSCHSLAPSFRRIHQYLPTGGWPLSSKELWP
jgi:hypothetical protein